MSFRTNLQYLRAERNMTQEQLAMLLGVSRQSVTKWEAERSYPEMDKLLKMCQLFDCTLDDLVQGDLTSRASQPDSPDGPRDAAAIQPSPFRRARRRISAATTSTSASSPTAYPAASRSFSSSSALAFSLKGNGPFSLAATLMP